MRAVGTAPKAEDERAARLRATLLESDAQFRAAMPSRQVSEFARQPGLGLGQTIARIMQGYADRPATAERATELATDPVSGRRSLRLLPEFRTRTYGQLWADATAIATEWAGSGIGAGDFIATIGFTSSNYVVLDLTAIYLGAVSVPLQPSSAVPQLQAIVDETTPALFAASPGYLDKAVELILASGSKPRQLMVFDYHDEVDQEREAFESAVARLYPAGVEVRTLEDVLEHGKAKPPAQQFVPAPGEDPLTMLIYTSGSTGAPKGAMYPERTMLRYWYGELPVEDESPAITLSFMPMSHMFGRVTIASTLGRGGITYFAARADLSTLFEDLALARPTELFAVPRIFDMLFQEYQGELDRREAEFSDPAELDAAVKADLHTRFLGGRVLTAMVGSAPISAEIKAFAEACLRIPLYDGYGATEFGVVLFDGEIQRPPVREYKLIDVPELGYFHTDRPHPRGELLLKTDTIFPGYYNRPEVTASMFDEDGFYKTGDVMAETGPDRLVYVDRRNNVQKLSQGEFVTLSKVESEFTANPLIRQIFAYGSSERPYLLAVVVPSEQALAEAGSAEAVRPKLAEAIGQTAKEAGLESFEIPREFLVETEPFSMANGLLSDIRKLLRPRLRERYGEQLEALYAELAHGQTDELRALRRGGPDQPVYETLTRAARALLGCAESEIHEHVRFTELGGDSLSALSFATLLGEIFEVDVPVGVVISPATDLRAIADYITAQRSGEGLRPSFASVHGAGATEIRASELTLEKFIDPATIATASGLPGPAATPRTVLLTGATGYLGRFMCIDWLERLAEHGGTLVCLVRGTDDAAARERLDATFDTGDAELLRHYRELAEDHLEVFAGDIGEADLGLDGAVWQRLAEEIDTIMHPGALVNHVLPYEQLFGPNVVGTAELIKLAITGRIKPFTNVSTIGVADQIEPGRFDEVTDIRELSSVRQVNDDYANGYGMSKWAGEVLLREAHDSCGLPVSVFRSDMILTHSRYTGQLNLPDMFTRLMLSLVASGIAPESFYRTDSAHAHYDGLPVDFSAEAVDTIGGGNTDGYHTYHVFNPHDDGISLDTFIGWLIEAGYRIERVPGYQDWLTRFSTALRGLPENQRQHSVLPLLHSYAEPVEPVGGGLVPAEQFRKAVQEAKIGADHDIPHITKGLIVKYITDLEQLELL